MKDTLILAIESSCDETAASVVKNGQDHIIQCDLITDRTSYIIWRSSTGNCIQKAYRKN